MIKHISYRALLTIICILCLMFYFHLTHIRASGEKKSVAVGSFQHNHQTMMPSLYHPINHLLQSDSNSPAMMIKLNNQVMIEQVYAKDVNVNIEIKNAIAFDEVNSFIEVNGKRVHIDWHQENTVLKAEMLIPDDGEYTLHAMILFNNGQRCEQRINFIIDKTAPELFYQEKNAGQQGNDELYDHEPTFEFNIKEVNLDYEHSYLIINGERIMLTQQKFEKTFSDGSYDVQYYLIDTAKQITKGQMKPFMVDSMAPSIALTLPSSAHHFMNEATLNVSIKEKNLKDVKVNCLKDGDVYPVIETWKKDEYGVQTAILFSDEGKYIFTISVDDQMGHSVQKKISFVIDNTLPDVHFTYDDQNPHPFINHDRMLRIDVNEKYIDLSQTYLTISLKGKNIQKHMNWLVKDTGVYTLLKLDEEGDYQIDCKATDFAGNMSHKSTSFCIDKTKPQIQFHNLDKRSVNHDIKIDCFANDLNFSVMNVNITKDDVSYLHLSGTKIKTFTLREEGEYLIQMSAEDKAGNRHIIDKTLLIDKTKPNVQVLLNHVSIGTKPYLTNQDISIDLNVYDKYLTTLNYQLIADGRIMKQGDTVFKHLIIEKELGKEHAYQLFVNAEDMSGNRKTIEYNFKIDTYLPVIKVKNDKFNGKARTGPWIPQLEGESVDFDISYCMLRKNGVEVPYIWNHQISEDGVYELRVGVHDQAMNSIQMTPVFKFTIDNLAPDIQLYDLTHEWFPKHMIPADSKFCLYLSQDDRTKREEERFLDVIMNNNSYYHKIKRDKTGLAYIMFSLKEDTHLIIKAIDEAGNQVKKEYFLKVVPYKHVKREIHNTKAKNNVIPKAHQNDQLFTFLITGAVILIISSVYAGCKIRHRSY